jgi:hypothetical protein
MNDFLKIPNILSEVKRIYTDRVLDFQIYGKLKNNWCLHPIRKASLTEKIVILRDSTMRTIRVFLYFNDIKGEILTIINQKTL